MSTDRFATVFAAILMGGVLTIIMLAIAVVITLMWQYLMGVIG